MEENLGNRLKKSREYMRLSQEQAAKHLGVSRNAVYSYENGIREPSNSMLKQMAALYLTTTDYLLGIERQHSINISGLTEREKSIITDLVDDLTEKNRK